MSQPVLCYGLYQALKKVGFDLPKECVDVDIKMPPGDALMEIIYRCWLTPNDLKKVSEALAYLASQQEKK